jgi:polyvinyl alcohol dehydrogenase (cytochrome)
VARRGGAGPGALTGDARPPVVHRQPAKGADRWGAATVSRTSGRPVAVGVALALVLAGCSSGGPSGDPTATRSPTATGSAAPGPGVALWPGYHADQARTGAVDGPSPENVRVAWRARLDGAVRGQPLVADGRILAATENDRVVALDPGSGRVLWSTSLGRPLTDVADAVGCGNIDPLGVTSTPVVDPATGTLYVVAEVSDGHGSVSHRLSALDVATGAVRTSAVVDPPLRSGETPLHLLQRASLALGNGRVYVSYGGHLGDCGRYHGWVVGAEESDLTAQVSFQVAADGEGGAIWQSGGAPALDGEGNLYVSTGNANPLPSEGGPDRKQYAESVVKLSPDLHPLASFKDTMAGGDDDLSTGNPVLLPDGNLFAVGKTDIGFVLRQSDLTQVAAVQDVCGSDPDGGPAYDRAHDRIFVPCRGGGIQVVDLRRPALGPRLAGADSAPVLIGGDLWALDSGDDTLSRFDAVTGTKEQTVSVGSDVPVFASPSTGLGLVLVGTSDGVTAFR